MRSSIFILSLLGIFAAVPAFAGVVVVIGKGPGRECFEQTLIDPAPARDLQALEICNRAVENNSGSLHDRAAALINRADILLRLGRFREVVADTERGISLDPGIGAAHLNRGAGLVGLQRYDEAVASLNQAIALGNGDLQLAYFDRGMARENLGDVRGAYYDYRKAAELDPSFQLAAQQLTRFTVKTR